MLDEQNADRLAIREIIENWVLYRDAGDFDRFAYLWHEDGRMVTTWFEASAAEFISRSRKAFAEGSQIIHGLGAITIDLAGDRAVAQSKMDIQQRAPVHDVVVDVVCKGRFYDFLEKRDGRWALVLRQPIYELDQIRPVDPAASLQLDQELLGSFPEGYRHLAYLQTHMGFTIRKDMPGTRGPEIEALYQKGKDWLAGSTLG